MSVIRLERSTARTCTCCSASAASAHSPTAARAMPRFQLSASSPWHTCAGGSRARRWVSDHRSGVQVLLNRTPPGQLKVRTNTPLFQFSPLRCSPAAAAPPPAWAPAERQTPGTAGRVPAAGDAQAAVNTTNDQEQRTILPCAAQASPIPLHRHKHPSPSLTECSSLGELPTALKHPAASRTSAGEAVACPCSAAATPCSMVENVGLVLVQ